MKAKARSRFDSRTLLLTASAGILVWLVISRSLAAFLAEANPSAALWLNPWESEALVKIADRTLNPPITTEGSSVGSAVQPLERSKGAPDSAAGGMNGAAASSSNFDQVFAVIDQNRTIDLHAVGALAESALMSDPLNAHALRILGQVADIAKDDQAASMFMRAAAHQSLHETFAGYWLMKKSAEAGDYNATIYYADALLRTELGISAYVMPVLAHLAVDKRGRGPLVMALGADPPWRSAFLGALPDYVTDARTPLEILMALRASSAPPTSADIAPYLKALIAHRDYNLAYYTWLQFLSPAELRNAGMLFNGNFQSAPSGQPFDWQISPGAGVTIDIVRRTDKTDARALLIEFQYGRVGYQSVTELVMLAPGNYRFTGSYKGELGGPRGLKWRIVCTDGATTRVGESAMITGKAPDWRTIEFGFTVPATNCPAQQVRLDLDARMASEQLVSGSVLFDELRISRAPSPPT